MMLRLLRDGKSQHGPTPETKCGRVGGILGMHPIHVFANSTVGPGIAAYFWK